MSNRRYRIPLFDLLTATSMAIDLVSPAVAGHHRRVAYIACLLAQRLAFDQEDIRLIIIAALLHDVGAFSAAERVDLLEFELQDNGRHAKAGAAFLARFTPFVKIAAIVRDHHAPWNNGTAANGCQVPAASHVLHLADRIEVLIKREEPILGQADDIHRRISAESGRLFRPEYVAAFTALYRTESFWFDLGFKPIDQLLRREVQLGELDLDIHGLTSLARMFCRLIDFKSPFTATHSSGVAASAVALSELAGFSRGEQLEIAVAGLLHDIGKLAIPAEILEKPARLSPEEFCVIQAHAYYSRRILESISDLATIISWGTAHHEHLDGRGYPFHLEDMGLPLGARILAVADVFTALTEDRPYRPGMPRAAVIELLDRMVADRKLEERIVTMLKEHYVAIDRARSDAQQAAAVEYESFRTLYAAS